MTLDNESGTSKLTLRILEDAKSDACATADEAARAVEKLRSEGEAVVAKKRAEYEKSRLAAVDGVIDGCRTRASIEGRKAALKRKREIIDDVFKRAYDALLALSPDQRGAICKRMLQSEAVAGETVLPAAADRQAIADSIAAGVVQSLKLDAQNAPYEGGFRLVGEGYEKDCSFASMIHELRDAEETAVAALLFN